MNKIIEDMFNQNWTGKETLSSIENMRKQLYKNLIYGGFLMDSKRGTKKQLTSFGEKFIEDFEKENK